MTETAAPPLHRVRFPGESAEYRDARDELLRAEMELRRQIEEVASKRRGLPLGGPVPVDYVFEQLDENGSSVDVRLSELFAPGKDTLVLYSFMYGPEMAAACPSCTSLLDGLDGVVPHLTQRIELAVVAKSPIARIGGHASARGWTRLRLLSSLENTYNRDYHAETEDGRQIPALNVFLRDGETIRHTYSTELLYAPTEPGQDPRHVDSIWPLWALHDLIPKGRPADWDVSLSYE